MIFPPGAASVYQDMPQRIINSLDELRGLVGQEVGVSDWFTVDQARINAFAEVTEDRQWIHSDTVRAEKELPKARRSHKDSSPFH